MVSVVIPCYNVEKNLVQRCLDSITNQTYHDMEILLIDDGSAAEYSAQLKELASKDDRIRYFYQENQGVSVARNYGTDIASGEYITYVDADDEVVPNFIDEAVRVAEKYKADFVIGGVRQTTVGTKKYKINKNGIKDICVFKNEEINSVSRHFIGPLLQIRDGGYFGKGPVARLVKAEIAKMIIFPVGIKYGEDAIWNQQILSMLSTKGVVVLYPSTFYFYYQDTSSTLHRYNAKIISDLETHLFLLKSIIDDTKRDHYYEFDSGVSRILCKVQNMA